MNESPPIKCYWTLEQIKLRRFNKPITLSIECSRLTAASDAIKTIAYNSERFLYGAEGEGWLIIYACTEDDLLEAMYLLLRALTRHCSLPDNYHSLIHHAHYVRDRMREILSTSGLS